MQIPDEVRQSVVFLYSKHGDEMVSRGTAFFVGVPSDSNLDITYMYLVAARHIVDGIRARGDDGNVHVRLNTLSGGYDWFVAHADRFIRHPDESQYLDVAVLAGA